MSTVFQIPIIGMFIVFTALMLITLFLYFLPMALNIINFFIPSSEKSSKSHNQVIDTKKIQESREKIILPSTNKVDLEVVALLGYLFYNNRIKLKKDPKE